MAGLNDKIENILNENRILILGCQVLIGFQFRAFFEPGFRTLGGGVRAAIAASLGSLLIAFTLLVAPAAYHIIVARGHSTTGVYRFGSRTVELALLPLALGLGVTLLVAASKVDGHGLAVAAAWSSTALALVFWYGLGLLARRREGGKDTMQRDASEEPNIEEKVKQVLIEARMVLPGTQALLGFQFITVLLDDFTRLPQRLKYLHLASLALIALSTVLLITPAAYHRIVEQGEATEEFHQFAARMVLASLVPLAMGIAGEFTVVVEKLTDSQKLGTACGIAALLFSYAIWFGFTGWLRRQKGQKPAST